MTFAAWEPATGCTGGPTDGGRALMAGCLEAYGARGATNLGIYNCRNVRGSTTTTSCHGEGRACDVGFPMVHGRANPDGRDLVQKLCAEAAGLGIQTVIYDRTIWSARSPSGREYTGVSPHYDHVHVELTRAAGRDLTLATVRAALGTVVGPDVPGPSGGLLSGIPAQSTSTWPVLRRGSRGPYVVLLQQKVGAVPDGDFGARTEEAVERFQADQGDLVVDGVVGAATWTRLMAAVPAPGQP